MSNTKSTKRALFSAVTAMLICVAMLIGTTFAWFNDSASTAVNKIQAGTLDVQLLAEDGTSLEGQTLSWQKAAGHESEEVLWEPGCTYKLQPIVIKNAGNLALKYKIVISGIQGDAKLNEAIEWTINDTALSADHLLAAGASDTLIISGHMKESAGNEYQGLSIDGISITVVATQDTVEYDSNNNTYDENAEYPVVVSANVDVTADNKVATKTTVVSSQKAADDTTPLAKVTIPAGAAVVEGTNQLKLTIDEVAAPANFVATVGTDNRTFEVDMKGLNKEANTELFKVEIYVGTGLENLILKHNGTDMNKKDSIESVVNDQDYYYNSSTGMVTFLTKTFSPFTFVYDKESWSKHAAESYETPVNTTDKIVTIASAEELALFAKEVNSGNSYAGYTVNLTEDVDLGQYAWKPIGQSGKPFNGTFNGQDHVISNLYVKGTQKNNIENNYHGLFGNLKSPAVVKDFTINNATVNGSLYVGAVAGMAFTGKEISGIKLTGDVRITGWWYVGGIAGNGYINEVKNCTVEANPDSFVKGIDGAYIGGIFGFRGEGAQKITNCVSNIDVEGYSYVGGISGMLHYGNTISGCTATGTVTKKAPADTTDLSDLYGIGGIAGISVDDDSKCLIENCTYNGKLVSNSDIVNGGVIGYNRDGQAANNLTVTNCTVNGTLVNIPAVD